MTSLVVMLLIVAALLSAPRVSLAGENEHKERPRARLLVFFATWCVPCRLELVAAQRFADTYRDDRLDVLAVSEDGPESAADIAPFLRRYKVSLPWVRDKESALLARYHPAGGVPFSVVLDELGEVVFARVGYEPGDEKLVERGIQTALARAKKPAKSPDPWHVTAMLQTLGVYRRTAFEPQLDAQVRGGVGRLQAGVSNNKWSASTRLDLAALDHGRLGTVTAPGLERVSLGFRRDDLQLHVGDAHAAIGAGLGLSLRKIDTLGVDTSIRGVSGKVKLGGYEGSLFAGVANAQNLDQVAIAPTQDYDDRLLGASHAYRWQKVKLRAMAVAASLKGASASGSDVFQALLGVGVDGDLPGIATTCEAWIGEARGRSAEVEPVVAAYCRAVWLIGDRWAITAEHKDYQRFELGRPGLGRLYHEPPTLERYDQVVADNRDAFGHRLRADLRPTAELSMHASALLYHYGEGARGYGGGNRVAHVHAGVERRSGNRGTVALAGGWRRDEKVSGALKSGLWHMDLDGSWRLSGSWTISGRWNHRSEVAVAFTERRFVRGLAVLGVAMRQRVVVSALYGYSTEKPALPLHYPGAELKVYLPRGGEVRLFGGRLAGGRVCVSGTCRGLPAYEGARLEAVLRL